MTPALFRKVGVFTLDPSSVGGPPIGFDALLAR